MDCCASTSVEGVATTIIVTAATTTIIITTILGKSFSTTETLVVFWDLLKRNRDFWKPKSRNSTCWAFFQLISSFSTLKVSFSALQWLEQLKCVICYPLALIIGIQRSIINYRTTNGIFALKKHLETNHQQVWKEWIEQEKDGGEIKKRRASKKRCGPTPSTISSFFGSIVLYNKDDPHQKQFEKDLILLPRSLCHYHLLRHHFFKDWF